jgi:hypothetical protein
MPLKLKEAHNQIEASIKQDNWSGSWGKINPTPQSATTLRLYKRNPEGEETHSYPYRALSCWRWLGNANQEELKIEAGPDAITVQGRGLVRLVDALDQGSLETLCEAPVENEPLKESSIWVATIIITDTPRSSK